eukprot:1196044-Prorocentrum_minimum.AAC.15
MGRAHSPLRVSTPCTITLADLYKATGRIGGQRGVIRRSQARHVQVVHPPPLPVLGGDVDRDSIETLYHVQGEGVGAKETPSGRGAVTSKARDGGGNLLQPGGLQRRQTA